MTNLKQSSSYSQPTLKCPFQVHGSPETCKSLALVARGATYETQPLTLPLTPNSNP